MKPSSRLGLMLRFNWGEHCLHSALLKPDARSSFFIGSRAGVDFACGDVAGTDRFELVSARAPLTVRFARGMEGTLWRSGDDCSLAHAIERHYATRDGDGFSVSLGARDGLQLEVGGVFVEASPVRFPAAVPSEVLASRDLRFVNVLAALLGVAPVS